MNLARREFAKGGLASLGFLALPGGLFAAPRGWKPKKNPNLVFGVMSDTHMRCHYDGVRFYDHNGWTYGDAAVVMALRYFKQHGADAVLHLGDITDVKQLYTPVLSSLTPTEDTIQQTNITGTEQKHRYRGRMFVLTTRQVSARSQKRAAGCQSS